MPCLFVLKKTRHPPLRAAHMQRTRLSNRGLWSQPKATRQAVRSRTQTLHDHPAVGPNGANTGRNRATPLQGNETQTSAANWPNFVRHRTAKGCRCPGPNPASNTAAALSPQNPKTPVTQGFRACACLTCPCSPRNDVNRLDKLARGLAGVQLNNVLDSGIAGKESPALTGCLGICET